MVGQTTVKFHKRFTFKLQRQPCDNILSISKNILIDQLNGQTQQKLNSKDSSDVKIQQSLLDPRFQFHCGAGLCYDHGENNVKLVPELRPEKEELSFQ